MVDKMKKRIIIILCLTVIGVGLFQTGRMVGASSSEPGSAGDPLITKSYLEERLGSAAGGIKAAGYVKVNLSKGQVLSAEQGAVFIIYTGNASVSGNNGLINLTSGELFENGTTAVLYSMFLSPENNSGIIASGNVIVYVQGGYSLR